MNELMLWKQLLGGGQDWVPTVLLGCLFLVVLWRPDRIRSLALFRVAAVLLALSVMAPSVLNVLLGLVGDGPSLRSYRSGSGGTGVLPLLGSASGTVLLGLSILFALLSLGPGQTSERPEPRDPTTPRRHPLEPQ